MLIDVVFRDLRKWSLTLRQCGLEAGYNSCVFWVSSKVGPFVRIFKHVIEFFRTVFVNKIAVRAIT